MIRVEARERKKCGEKTEMVCFSVLQHRSSSSDYMPNKGFSTGDKNHVSKVFFFSFKGKSGWITANPLLYLVFWFLPAPNKKSGKLCIFFSPKVWQDEITPFSFVRGNGVVIPDLFCAPPQIIHICGAVSCYPRWVPKNFRFADQVKRFLKYFQA